MIDIKDLLKNPNKYRDNLKKRNWQEKDIAIIDKIIDLKTEINNLIVQRNHLKETVNKLSKTKPYNETIDYLRQLKIDLKKIDDSIEAKTSQLNDYLFNLPNIIASDVPLGKSEKDNLVIKQWGDIKKTDHQYDHIFLGKKYDILDIDRAAKIAGSRFYYFKNDLVLLEFSLINFVFDFLKNFDFIPIIPPFFIREKYYKGMGRLAADQKEERYYLPKDDLYLIGSAEHTIGPYYADEVLSEKELPKRFLGFSSCFRREAGSYGKDVKGILRTHQFDKLEMFSFTLPEQSETEHQFLLSLQEKIMQALKLPYRVVLICSGDIGFTDYKQYDIEAWIPSQNRYRETHSCSNTTDFQARGVNARFRRRSGKIEFIHTLNATAVAIGRIIIAILENYQKDNYIEIPEVLQPYMRKDKIVPPAK